MLSGPVKAGPTRQVCSATDVGMKQLMACLVALVLQSVCQVTLPLYIMIDCSGVKLRVLECLATVGVNIVAHFSKWKNTALLPGMVM